MVLDDEPEPAVPRRKLNEARAALRKVDNPLGKHLVDQATSSMTVPVLAMHEAAVDAARLRIALRLFERRHGKTHDRLCHPVGWIRKCQRRFKR